MKLRFMAFFAKFRLELGNTLLHFGLGWGRINGKDENWVKISKIIEREGYNHYKVTTD